MDVDSALQSYSRISALPEVKVNLNDHDFLEGLTMQTRSVPASLWLTFSNVFEAIEGEVGLGKVSLLNFR